MIKGWKGRILWQLQLNKYYGMLQMVVEDEEPLTHQDQSGKGRGDARYSGGPASIETILTSALHKRAAKKLGKVGYGLLYIFIHLFIFVKRG